MSDKKEQERKAAEQAEKNMKIQKLQSEANVISQKAAYADNLIDAFNNEKKLLTQNVLQIEQVLYATLSNQLVSQVRVSKVFEGEIAEQQATNLSQGVGKIRENITKVKNLISGIDDQIRRLTTYRDQLQDQLSNLTKIINSI